MGHLVYAVASQIFEAGAAPRGGLGWTCPSDFFGDRFSNSSKFDERRLTEGHFFPSQRSILDIPRLQLRRGGSSQKLKGGNLESGRQNTSEK